MFGYYLRLALHGLLRNPILTTLVVVAIGIGIGASMTTLTILRAMSGNPLPQKSTQLFAPQIDNWGPVNDSGPDGALADDRLPDELTRFAAHTRRVALTDWLLDTNILSELRRPKPERKVIAFVEGQPLDLLFISAVTLAEFRFGIELLPEAACRLHLNDWLTHEVRPMFEQRVLPITEEIMFKWRLLLEEGRKVGHTFSQPDLIIAATALHHGLTVVSRDTGECAKANVAVFNPWREPLPPAM